GPKTYYAFSAKATKLHSALTEINKTLRNLKNNKEDMTNIEDINKSIQKINKLAATGIPTINEKITKQ
ncbi:11465_t:CDS:1, partial [Ambispora leptoticha]